MIWPRIDQNGETEFMQLTPTWSKQSFHDSYLIRFPCLMIVILQDSSLILIQIVIQLQCCKHGKMQYVELSPPLENHLIFFFSNFSISSSFFSPDLITIHLLQIMFPSSSLKKNHVPLKCQPSKSWAGNKALHMRSVDNSHQSACSRSQQMV